MESKTYTLTNLNSAVEIVDEIGKVLLGHDLKYKAGNGKDIYSFTILKGVYQVRYASNQIMINGKDDAINIGNGSVIVIDDNGISVALDQFDKHISVMN